MLIINCEKALIAIRVLLTKRHLIRAEANYAIEKA